MLAIIPFLLSLIVFIKPVFAGEPPTQTGPSNGSTVTTSTLNWQVPSYQLYSSKPYRVQVDDNPSFSPSSSIYRDAYKTATTYTPELTNGTWYWRLKVKDSNGAWSNWSSVWSFTLSSSTPSPSSTPAPTSTPLLTPTSQSSSFTVSNVPAQINSDQPFNILVNTSLSDNPNATFYLKGAFRHPDKPSNYFGFTKLDNGEWVKNSSTYTNQYKITTNSSGNWSGNIEVKPDADDSGFIGTGDYIFKIGRYKDSENSSVTWSNESNIKIISTESEEGDTSILDTPSSTTIPSPSPHSVSKKSNSLSQDSSKINYNINIASIAGIAATATPSASPNTEVRGEKQINFLSIVGAILVIIGFIPISYAIYNKFRKRN